MKEINFKVFYIPKKHGYRKIITYKKMNDEIYNFHRKVNAILYRRVLPSKFAKAYIKRRSIIKNAKSHMYNDIFFVFDIKNFFQSINHRKLIQKLYYEINLNHKKKVTKINCIEIVKSCSVSNKGLAVGLIPSPFLANIYLKDFDNILYGKLKKLNMQHIIYTRYADDLIISYNCDKPKKVTEIKSIVSDSLCKFGLKLNDNKTRIIDLNKSNHVKITGINVIKLDDNLRKLSVGRKRKDDLYRLTIELGQKRPDDRNNYDIQKVKGLQAFIISVEGEGYESCYSKNMMLQVNELGYSTLKELISSM